MRAPARASRGHTLAEMIVSLTIMAIIGAALAKLIVVEGRAFGKQLAAKAARTVTRGALNYLQSELRMVETSGGVRAASPTSITLRVPYALGVVCNATNISTLPADSVMYAQATFGGYAWRDNAGVYTYVDPATSVVPGTSGPCTTAGVVTLPGGLTLVVSPALPAGANAGDNVLLFQTITYSLGPSALVPGHWGLFRTTASGTPEEIAAPLDSAASRFAFYNLNADTAQATVPPVANIRGIELHLAGQSDRIPRGSRTFASAALNLSILFANRMD